MEVLETAASFLGWLLLGYFAARSAIVRLIARQMFRQASPDYTNRVPRRERHIWRDLPPPDLSEYEARRYVNHPRFKSMPGTRNGAIWRYLAGLHSAREMEERLDKRLGLDRYYRGKLIREHEQMAKISPSLGFGKVDPTQQEKS